MVYQSPFFFDILLIIVLLSTGCTSPHIQNDISHSSGDNLSLQRTIISLSATPVVTDLNTTVSNVWGSGALQQNTFESLQFSDNASYEVSLGDATIKQNETHGSNFSYIVEVNVTAKNTGAVPIEVVFLGVTFADSSGDGCSSTLRSWCGIQDWFRIDPGVSNTSTLKIHFDSSKELSYLSSQKFILDGIINAETMKFSTENHRKSWFIILNNSTEPAV